jgi:hypothetical protein
MADRKPTRIVFPRRLMELLHWFGADLSTLGTLARFRGD